MAKEELSEGETEEGRAVSVKNTLESKLIQDTLATNTVLTNQNAYGSENVRRAESYYNTFTSGEEFTKARDADYKKTVDAYKKLGVYGEPSRPNNADLSAKLVNQFNEVTQIATLEELLAGAKKAGAKLDQEELPKELKNYSYKKLIDLATEKGALKDGKVSIDKLSQDEQSAFVLYDTLVEVYKEACVQRVCSPYGEYNKKIKEICDSYNPKSQEQEK